ncbi:MAG: NAD(+) synthase [Clostridiales bacterium]
MYYDSALFKDLKIDAGKEIERITNRLRNDIAYVLRKKGAVIGISGGIDSSVVLALCVKALGNEKVLAVMIPEKESDPGSILLAKELTARLKVNFVHEDITSALEGFGCYRRRDEAIKKIFPEYTSDFKVKITISQNTFQDNKLNFFRVVIISPKGEVKTERLPVKEYLEITAASNLKQRCRMSMLYLHAESHNFAVVGTGNKDEHYLGFFVKYGDGAADIKPIAHLFKTQVYQLSEHLEIPLSIRKRTPTTDTYSASQTQEEFFFGLPFEVLDYILYNREMGISAEKISEQLNISPSQVQNIINDITRKMRTTEYLRKEPIHIQF